MTEPGITPAQTAGPYLRIGLLRNILTPNVVDPADPRAIRLAFEFGVATPANR